MGHPIVGDATYTDDTGSPRMMLHAWKLRLPFSQVPPKRLMSKQRRRSQKRSLDGANTGDVAINDDTAAIASIPALDIAIESQDPFAHLELSESELT